MFGASDGQGLRRADVDDLIAAVRIEMIVGETAKPAERLAGIRHAGVPVTHRREVREARVVVAAAVHDSHPPVFVEALESHHRRMEAERVADLQHLFRGDADTWTRAIVRGIGVRHDGVQPVVSARQFQHDEDPLRMLLEARALKRLRGERGRRPTEKHRETSADTDSIQTTRQEISTRTVARHDSWYSGALSTR